ncbi:hypothetical protein [Methanoculleus chikugoensis]|uniref:hypothetical protein n=1 Tax=Methanoculleus chikugoensis TaxID=118126 RepID=UPI001FB3A332|nr:hypothetical protein [Methanoculleus chikugoensis]
MRPRTIRQRGVGSTRRPDFAPCGARALFLTEHRTSHLMVLTLLPFGQSHFAASRSSRETVLVSSLINSREGAKNAKDDGWNIRSLSNR